MAQAMDARSSFLYLVDNLPAWKTSIEALSAHAAQKTDEFAAEYARIVNQTRPKRRRSASMASIHTQDDGCVEQPNEGLKDALNPLEVGNRHILAAAKRIRKTGASVRSGASGPAKYRNKSQLVVHYDAYLQEQLDAMVKSLGVGRNNLRKGKNALAVARGFRLPTLTSRVRPGYPPVDSLGGPMMSRSTSALLSGKKPLGQMGQTPPSDEAAFLQVDKELESVQSLCETAAHQFLRDGDCRPELDNILQKMDAILIQATSAAESLKTLQEEKETSSPESQQDNGVDSEDIGTLLSSYLPPFPKTSLPDASTSKASNFMHTGVLTINNTLEDMKTRGIFFSAPAVTDSNHADLMSDKIEVDDASDQSSIVVDISQYRLANPRRTRV